MAYELLVLDLDGTLTNSKKEISPATKEALMELQKRGKKVVLASGRPTCGIVPLAEELDLKTYGSYILSFNGARIVDCGTDNIVYNQCISAEHLPKLYQVAKDNGVAIVTAKDNVLYSAFEADKYVDVETSINKLELKVCPNFVESIDFPMNKVIFAGKPEILERLEIEMKEYYGDTLSIFRSEPFFLEFMPKNIDKAYSLGKLLETLGMTKDQMICCGDGFNDLTMIKFAGLGVAMANAQQVVLDNADYITLSNDEDGIIPVIEKFMMD